MTNIGKKLLTICTVLQSMISCKPSKKSGTGIIDYEYFPPVGEEKDVAILILGGSDGVMPYHHHHTDLTVGCPVMLLGYFYRDNTPNMMKEIPLEYFDEAIDLFKSMDNVKDKKLILLGTSKGGELALLIASRNTKVDGVIAKVPASVAFQGAGLFFSSTWSIGGKPYPFVRFEKVEGGNTKNTKFVEICNRSLDMADTLEEATIKVENIKGPILLLSGVEDTVWPATRMSNDIVKRLKDNNFKYNYEHIAYEDAGHSLSEYWYEGMGGSKDGNKKARLDSITRIINFIDNI